ncbi:MAG: DUF2254 domain-containing protein [Isosphaeraceae bacterium]|nr:DUF2254 domain-containing protein [Isosphaeraceae bacterium]
MNERVWPWQVAREMSGGFVLWPGIITLSMAGLALVLAAVEERVTALTTWGHVLDRIFPPEPESAHVVLGTIAGSMITVVSVVYSILLVVLTFASAQFSPRVLVAFVEDKVSQTTLGVFVGTFVYCLLTLPSVRSQPTPFVPSIAVIIAMGLAVGCLGCLLYFIHHIAVSIQASHIVDRVARDTERIVDQVLPAREPEFPLGEPAEPIPAGAPILATESGYIRTINEAGLIAAAEAHDVSLRVDRYIGQFVAEGTPLLGVSPPDRASGPVGDACRQAFHIGPARTMEQDVEFGVLQIVDIALKAISPAVNDPTTALTCVDQLGRILVRAALRAPPAAVLRGRDGRPRVVMRRTSFPRMLDVAFSQIRHYGRADVAVPLRLMRVLAELACATQSIPYAIAIRDEGRRLAAACAEGYALADRRELNERLEIVERAASLVTTAAANESGKEVIL